MGRWIEVPAHRVLEITRDELDLNFSRLNVEGQTCRFGEVLHRIVRKSDNKVFKFPRYHHEMADCGNLLYIEEI